MRRIFDAQDFDEIFGRIDQAELFLFLPESGE